MTDRLLRIKAVCQKVSLGQTTVRALVASGEFPQPIRIRTAVLWRETDVDQWIGAQTPGELAPPAADSPSPRSSRAARSALSPSAVSSLLVCS